MGDLFEYDLRETIWVLFTGEDLGVISLSLSPSFRGLHRIARFAISVVKIRYAITAAGGVLVYDRYYDTRNKPLSLGGLKCYNIIKAVFRTLCKLNPLHVQKL